MIRAPAAWAGPALALAWWVGERVLGRPPRRAPDAPRDPPVPPPPRFTERQIAEIARESGGVTTFDREIALALRRLLRSRSAVPVAIPEIGGRVGTWAVCPLRPDAERASDVVDRAEARGVAVLGSFSLVLLATGAPCSAILVTAPDPRDAAALAGPRPGHLAVLAFAPAERPAPEVPVAAAPATPPAEILPDPGAGAAILDQIPPAAPPRPLSAAEEAARDLAERERALEAEEAARAAAPPAIPAPVSAPARKARSRKVKAPAEAPEGKARSRKARASAQAPAARASQLNGAASAAPAAEMPATVAGEA